MGSRPTPLPGVGSCPSVGVVVATHNRPRLVRAAIDSVLTQSYEGPIDLVVVFDDADPDPSLVRSDSYRRVRVCRNNRAPGLAGARNTGILTLETELIAFCDDDDAWLESKLAAQLDRMAARTGAQFITTAMQVDYCGRISVRLAGTDRVTIGQLVRSRMAML